jgi:hypothetical protein
MISRYCMNARKMSLSTVKNTWNSSFSLNPERLLTFGLFIEASLIAAFTLSRSERAAHWDQVSPQQGRSTQP